MTNKILILWLMLAAVLTAGLNSCNKSKKAPASSVSGLCKVICDESFKGILRGQGRAYRSRRIAVDAIALIVNKDNDIDFLSMSDIKDIMTGKSTKWGQVYPTKLKNDSIKVIFDQNRSAVVHYMKDKFNDGKDLPIAFYAQGSSQAVFDAVEKTRNAIGVIGVSWITSDMK